ncbi:MBL fold metallo-hydrolase [Mumia zhuanghuii]|uniref:MBL fold metallo-hydrolase n=1 Tax=Mumia zhuanghuii TaxID=2585211 RepID=A0A5C4N521_9ACTN|nr:MBL fold metallo-hydrolase [Mumia zhuanghuii]TNC51390.1 MBL fold metallo-hydrolase [Mumia zhuanghuii]
MQICATCGVEFSEPLPEVCPICADERQWVPAAGQRWTTTGDLAAAGQTLVWTDREPGRAEITTEPHVGIGQTAQLVTTETGSLLWDPPGYVDDETARRILERGPVLAVAASHPHMFGVQTAWGEALDAPVLVCASDAGWLGRRTERVQLWEDDHALAPGLSLHRVGGHFVGAAVAHWTADATGRGLLLSGDTVFPNPDRRSVGFMRSYPNKIPLSAGVVQAIADRLARFDFDRIVGNFGNLIDGDAKAVLEYSAARHIAWVRGDHDDETGIATPGQEG